MLLVGCTHVQRPAIQTTVLPPETMVQKIPLKVALVMDSNWTNYTFKFGKMGDTWEYPLGGPLMDYARSVSSHSFQEVTESPDASSVPSSADVILSPAVAKMDHAAGMLAWQDRKLIMLVEWTMRDRNSKNMVWLSTIEANAAHSAGNLFTGGGNERRLFQALFDELTTNTLRAFQEAPEIKTRSGSR